MKNDMILFFQWDVALIQSQKDLHEDFPDDIFSNEILLSSALLDKLSHITIFAVLHDDQQLFLFLQNDLVVVLHNV